MSGCVSINNMLGLSTLCLYVSVAQRHVPVSLSVAWERCFIGLRSNNQTNRKMRGRVGSGRK